MKDRIRQLRKELGLNQTEFGERISVKQGSVASYESGARTPIDAVVTSICREFNVNEEWLKYGTGEMFCPEKENSIVAKATMLLGEKDPLFEAFIDTYSKLSPKNRELLQQFMLDFSQALAEKKKE